ncbi:Clp protease N-terminal domain-containing protein [Streptomyces sp. NPDC048604]|uniref:Clp protease N-terminal domain-containing protein n=1 Tax=Streptomyces sp. NPDC048604 TaxID=3365578 RepID=UPI003717EC08
MHHPVPRIPAQSAASPQYRLAIESRLTVELAMVVTGSRRRALRDGDRQVDTAHLLHSLVETDPAVRAAFTGEAQVSRVLGYLVQRSIGYGLRWRKSAAPSSSSASSSPAAASASSTEVARGPLAAGPGGWSPAAAAAMDGALARAARRGDLRAAGLDVLAVLVADRDCRAVEVLRRAGVDPDVLAARIAELSQQV